MALIFQFALGVCGAMFGAGIIYATVRRDIIKAQDDANNIGGICRANDAKQERRWLFDVADDVEAAENKEQRSRLAARIRHEAFRH